MKRSYSILAALALFAQAVFATAIVSIAPSISFVNPAGTLLLDLQVTGVTDLYAFQFDIAFDPAVLSAGSVTEGGFLPGAGTTFFIPGTVDNVAGIISFTADSLTGFVPGVNGSGSLALIEFTGLAPGTSAVQLSSVLLLDSALNEVTAGTADGSVTVASSVPEPGSSGLLCVGLGLCLLGLRARRVLQSPVLPPQVRVHSSGVGIVSFSGDKLLGGPQAGIVAGSEDLIARLRPNPMFRALRLGKVLLAALESTLRHVLFEEWDRVPALGMIRATAEEIRVRAQRPARRVYYRQDEPSRPVSS